MFVAELDVRMGGLRMELSNINDDQVIRECEDGAVFRDSVNMAYMCIAWGFGCSVQIPFCFFVFLYISVH